MGIFTPFKRHAKKFNYIPRYYDPAKEAREQRRAELRGVRSDDKEQGKDKGEYKPGKYIRTQRAARSERLKDSGSDRKSKLWMTVLGIAAFAYMGMMLYNKLVEMFVPSPERTERYSPAGQNKRAMREFEEFDPYAPITIVPNDYDPNK